MAQEAIGNVRKHARADNLWVTLESDGTALSLEVEDDGVGNAGPREHHWGLQTMRERAEGVGAQLDITPRPAAEPSSACGRRSRRLTKGECPWAPPCYWLTTTS